MSDSWICIIPKNPFFVPSNDSIARAEELLARIAPDSDEVSSEISNNVQFRDCGENLERIQCPVCMADVDRERWLELMDNVEDSDFIFVPVILPCGHTIASLNEIKYYWDQGFSRFTLEAMNPNIGEIISEQLADFEQILGCTLKVIYQHI